MGMAMEPLQESQATMRVDLVAMLEELRDGLV